MQPAFAEKMNIRNFEAVCARASIVVYAEKHLVVCLPMQDHAKAYLHQGNMYMHESMNEVLKNYSMRDNIDELRASDQRLLACALDPKLDQTPLREWVKGDAAGAPAPQVSACCGPLDPADAAEQQAIFASLAVKLHGETIEVAESPDRPVRSATVQACHGPLTVEDAREQQAILGTLAKEAHNEVHDLLTPQKRKRSGSDEDIDGETADSAEVRDAELEAAIYDGLMYEKFGGDAEAADYMFGAGSMDGDGDE